MFVLSQGVSWSGGRPLRICRGYKKRGRPVVNEKEVNVTTGVN